MVLVMESSVVLLSLAAFVSAALLIRAEYKGPIESIYLFKPLTMIFIILIALSKHPYTSSSGVFTPSNVFASYQSMIVLGMIFSLIGDVCLMAKTRDLFQQGLISFAVAHMCYIIAFTSQINQPLLNCVVGIQAVPFVLFGAFMITQLLPYLDKLRPHVIAYMSFILLMGLQAYNRYAFTPNTHCTYALIGALFFIGSDSLLAWNKFRAPFNNAAFWVLGTYFAAQWFMALSI